MLSLNNRTIRLWAFTHITVRMYINICHEFTASLNVIGYNNITYHVNQELVLFYGLRYWIHRIIKKRMKDTHHNYILIYILNLHIKCTHKMITICYHSMGFNIHGFHKFIILLTLPLMQFCCHTHAEK